jgi:DNA repair exonuclease SbcCD ATPase subunit
MKNINFRKLGFENFCCYEELFELEIQNNKLILISGQNGSGKTSIFDSIIYTLYGVTSKGLKGKDVINNRIGKNCHTYVEFSINDDNYRVDRYSGHSKMGDTVILNRNDVPYKKGHQEVVAEIERILLPKKIFTNVLFFGQKVKTFFTELKDTEQKEIFRKILKLDIYVNYNKKCSDLISIVEKELSDIDNQISAKNFIISDLKNQVVLLNKEKEDFEKTKENKIKEYTEKRQELEKNLIYTNTQLEKLEEYKTNIKLELVNSKLSTHNQQLKEIDSEFDIIVDQIKIKLQNKQYEITSINNDKKTKLTEEYNTRLTCLNESVSTYESNQKLDKAFLEHEISLINNTIQFNKITIKNLEDEKLKFFDTISSTKISVCPTCHQEIDDDVRLKLNEYVESISNKIKVFENENDNYYDKIKYWKNEYEIKIKELNNQLSKTKKDINDLKSKFKKDTDDMNLKLKNSIQELQKMANEVISNKTSDIKNKKQELVDKIKEIESEKNELNKILTQVKKLKDLITSINSEINKYSELINLKTLEKYDLSRLKSCCGKIRDTHNEVENLKIKIIELKKKHDILLFWKEAFSKSGMESMLIDQSIPYMNMRVSQYLNEISNNRYNLTFDTLKKLKNGEYSDKIDLHVLDSVTLSDSREKFSSGQIRVLDVAIILTLCDLQSNIQDIKFNIMMFDEIMDSLDNDNIEMVSKVLKNLTKNKSIFLISHRTLDIEFDEELKL